MGTYGYMAPEQFRGAASPASDLYGLGGTLLLLLSGRPPSAFPIDRMRIDFGAGAGLLFNKLLPPSKCFPWVPVGLTACSPPLAVCPADTRTRS